MSGQKKRLKILSSGVFYTPIDTPAHSKGWWAEITFFHDPRFPFLINKDPISQKFDSKEKAQKYLNRQRMKLYMSKEYHVKETTHEEIRRNNAPW